MAIVSGVSLSGSPVFSWAVSTRGSWSLRDLDARFKDIVHQKRIPKLHGIEAYENHFVLHRKFLPDRYLVVTEESAGRYFGAPILLRNTDHFSCVKPNNLNHPAHELLVDFWQREFAASNTRFKKNNKGRARAADPAPEKRIVLYVDFGRLIEVDDSSKELTARDKTKNREICNLILSKYGSEDQRGIFVFANEVEAFTTAKLLFADLATSAGEFQFDKLRIGVGYGSVSDDKNMSATGALDAQHAALDPILDRVGASHGVFVSKATIDRFGDLLQSQFGITQFGVGVGKSIYRLPFSREERLTTRIEVMRPLPSNQVPYIVCVGSTRGTTKVSAPEKELAKASIKTSSTSDSAG